MGSAQCSGAAYRPGLPGDTEAAKVTTSVGPEQEYFLVDRDTYNKREDLIFAGRTLFGAPAPKDRNWTIIIRQH